MTSGRAITMGKPPKPLNIKSGAGSAKGIGAAAGKSVPAIPTNIVEAVGITNRGTYAVGTILVTSGGGGSIPTGVTLREPDGGRTFYATNGFTKATAYPTTIAWPSGGSITYTNGWDDLRFFPIGGAISTLQESGYPGSTTDYLIWGWNTQWYSQSDTLWADLTAAGISQMQGANELHLALAFNGLATDGSATLPACVTIMGMADEVNSMGCWIKTIGGDEADVNGTLISGGTDLVTNLVQDGRPWWTGFAGARYANLTKIDDGFGSQVVAWPYTQTYQTPNTTLRRPHDITGMDAYAISPSYRPWSIYRGVGPAQLNNMVCGTFGSPNPFTAAEHRRGSHQGVLIDYSRIFCDTVPRPIIHPLQLSDGLVNCCYLISGAEMNWEVWSTIVHGARGILFFDYGDNFYNLNSVGQGNTPKPGILRTTEMNHCRSTSFTGAISGNTLTVTNSDTRTSHQQITVGMEIVTGAGSAPFPVVLFQNTFDTEATFNVTATVSDGTYGTLSTITVTSGTIPVPSQLDTSGTSPDIANLSDPKISAQIPSVTGGNGTYNINRGMSAGTTATGWKAYCPGMNGTYTISKSLSIAATAMTARQPDAVVLGNRAGTNSGVDATGSMVAQVSATCNRVRDLARVINSRFALGYVTSSSTGLRFIFPNQDSGTVVPKDFFTTTNGIVGTDPVVSGAAGRAYFLEQGVDCCVHYYEGSTYTSAISSESITTNTFYIFATTSYSEDTTSISVTFNTADTTATSVTVIGEARSIGVSGGSFTDTFEYAWTVHIYRVNH